MSEHEILFDKLEALGDTADGVAASLAKMGIKGVRDGCNTCPIAVFLLREGYVTPQVGISCVSTSTPGGVEINDLYMPVSALMFIIEFDGEDYPELVEAAA